MDTFLSILKMVGIIIQVVLLFNLLILVHELGHYWAALWRGLKVEKFQIWFGKPIWKKKIRGVQWGMGWIPAGGFVALPQMAPMEAVEGASVDPETANLPDVSPMDKIIVAFAGPLFSLLLAFAFALVVWGVGRPVSSVETTTTIGYVSQEMPAGKAGMEVGDEILLVDGNQVETFFGMTNSVVTSIAFSEGETVEVVVRREGFDEPLSFEMVPEIEARTGFFDRGGLRRIGIGPATPPVVGLVVEGSPAYHAGLKVGDRVVEWNGKALDIGQRIDAFSSRNPGEPMELVVERGENGERFAVELAAVTPELPEDLPATIGVAWAPERTLVHPGPFEQIAVSGTMIFQTIGGLISSKSDISVRHLSGPVGIGGMFYDLLKSPDGWRMVFWFAVVVNVNLALLNMLPLPVLDGGHITLALLEKLRGKPVGMRILEPIQALFAILLIGFMLYITVIDTADRAGRSGEGERQPMVFPEVEN